MVFCEAPIENQISNNHFVAQPSTIQFRSKLINVLLTHIRNAINHKTTDSDLESFGSTRENSSERVLYKTTKNLQYIMKFVIRSRILFANLNDNRDHHSFEASLECRWRPLYRFTVDRAESDDSFFCSSQLCCSRSSSYWLVQMICYDLRVPCSSICT